MPIIKVVPMPGTPGPSAYDIAVTNGFEGTEQEWLASIGSGEAVPTDTSFTVAGGALGTQPTFNGSPLFSGSYVKTGDLVNFRINVDMTNITNFGAGQYYVELPFNSKYAITFRDGCLHDTSTGKEYHISGHTEAGIKVITLHTSIKDGTSIEDSPFTPTSPVNLDVTDIFHIAGAYIAEA